MTAHEMSEPDPAPQGAPPLWATAYGLDVASPFPFAELELGDGVVMQWRWIPPGHFLMGSPDDEVGRWRDESPQHEVELTRGFWLAETPCTQSQWAAVMHSKPSKPQGEQLPVVNVSWEDCQEYCARLNERFPELGIRLPTEAEWEYACRAGTTSAFNDGSPCTEPDGRDPALEGLGWYGSNSGGETHPVAQKAANAWGLFDMHGNVWEWCADWWQGDYQDAGSVDPSGPPTSRNRVIRGGGAWDNARNCRSASRDGGLPGERNSYQGFRPAAGQSVSKEPPEGVEGKEVKERGARRQGGRDDRQPPGATDLPVKVPDLSQPK